MAVRFLPVDRAETEDTRSAPEREDHELAEVISLRSRLAVSCLVPEDDEAVRAEAHEQVSAEADSRVSAGEASAADDGTRLMARKARSSGELRDELLNLGHDAYEVDAVIAEFERSLYLDDLGLARYVSEKQRTGKGASRAQIRRKLRERKLPDDVIEQVCAEIDPDEDFSLMRETARDRARRLGGLDRQTAERRLLGFLARRGWSGEPALRAAREALDGEARGRSSGGVRFR